MVGCLHRTRIGLAAVAIAVLGTMALVSRGSLGTELLGGVALAAWTLWPVAILFARPRWWRYQAEGEARTVGVVLGCSASLAWTATIVTSDSSTAVLGFVWSPLIALTATLVPYGVLRGPRLRPEAPPEDPLERARAVRVTPHG
jgi:hypothetical protein